MRKRCNQCHKLLTWKEETYNWKSRLDPLCDDCRRVVEQATFIYKGGGNDSSTSDGMAEEFSLEKLKQEKREGDIEADILNEEGR